MGLAAIAVSVLVLLASTIFAATLYTSYETLEAAGGAVDMDTCTCNCWDGLFKGRHL